MIKQNLKYKISELEKRFHEIPTERKKLLNQFALYISGKLKSDEEINLIFICTHNSRRSHMSQIWAQTSAEYFNVPNVKCFSGGTEATSFNPRAVKAISSFGFQIEKLDDSENPNYLVYFSDDKEPLKCFSKVYTEKANPQNNFAAIMTCSDADEKCPIVIGADERFPIRYDDPKEFDDTELEEVKYKERFGQIGIEMLYTFNKVQKKEKL